MSSSFLSLMRQPHESRKSTFLLIFFCRAFPTFPFSSCFLFKSALHNFLLHLKFIFLSFPASYRPFFFCFLCPFLSCLLSPFFLLPSSVPFLLPSTLQSCFFFLSFLFSQRHCLFLTSFILSVTSYIPFLLPFLSPSPSPPPPQSSSATAYIFGSCLKPQIKKKPQEHVENVCGKPQGLYVPQPDCFSCFLLYFSFKNPTKENV